MDDRAEKTWALLVAEHGPAVWRTAYRILNHYADAQDCYQETFLGAVRFSRLRAINNWEPLLVSIATRRAIDRLRQRVKTRNRLTRLDAATHDAANTVLPADTTLNAELMETLRAGLGELPEKQAATFWLRNVEELSYAEIAAELDIDTNEVGVLLHRARMSLKRRFTIDETGAAGSAKCAGENRNE